MRVIDESCARRTIDAETQLCAVIGNPIEHSLSPAIHNAAFEAAGLNFVYLAFRVEDVRACLAGMRAMPSFRGLSVTIPHKLAVMEHLDEIDPMAEHVGAVNTVCHASGRLIGTTTDGPGALRAIENAGVSLDGKRVLFIGAGGAVRSAAFAVAEMTACSQVTILGRTQSRVNSLVRDLREKTKAAVEGRRLPEDLSAAMVAHEVIINGTPLGMFPNSVNDTPVPKELLSRDHVVFDMVYRPTKTRLVQEAERAGCKIVPGIEMLIHQAALQFETWTGVRAPIQAMRSVVFSHWEAQQ
jgi:shikimate dehydrogenase